MYTVVHKLSLLLFLLPYLNACTAQQCNVATLSYNPKESAYLGEVLNCELWKDRLVTRFNKREVVEAYAGEEMVLYSVDTLLNGEPQYLTLLTRSGDSSFTILREYQNLLPRYYKNYSLEYLKKYDPEAFASYPYTDGNPVEELEIKSNTCKIKIRQGFGETLDFVYTYEDDIRDFNLTKVVFVTEDLQGVKTQHKVGGIFQGALAEFDLIKALDYDYYADGH